jgi:RimJ/RimL family protein N-acetyltransferase
MQVLLETERLTLRRFTEADGGRLYDLDSDPEDMRYLSGGAGTPRQVIETEILPLFMTYDERFPGFGIWAAMEKASGGFLGWFSFRPKVEAEPREVVLGFRLRQSAWGRGYATEGARALIRLGFTQLGVQRVLAATYEENLASRRVMEKAGLSLTRRFRLTGANFEDVDTYQADAGEPWEGEDLEYLLQRTDWIEQERK